MVSLALVGSVALSPLSPALADTPGSNPLAPLGGFTVVTAGDGVLGNVELEGSLAVGGDLSILRSYAFIHSSGLTPTDYALPTVDGDPTRVLIGGQYLAASSSGVAEASSHGNTSPAQLGFVKIGDTSNVALNPRGSGGAGVWISASGTSAGSEPAIYVTDRVAQPQSTVSAPGAFAAAFEGSFSILTDTATSLTNLDTCTQAHRTALTPGSHAGQRAITLVAGFTNYLTVTAADLSFSEIVFDGVQPSADTPVIFNVIGSPDSVTIPRFVAANNSSATNPNLVAPFVLWNFGAVPGPVTIHGEKVSGSILAPDTNVILDASSPFEGQLVAQALTTAGGEIHHYAFQGNVACLTGEPDPVETTGSFQISKALTGPTGLVPETTEFTVEYTVDNGPAASLTLLADGTPVTVTGLPVGAEVAFVELAPPVIPGVTWVTAAFSESTITIGDGTVTTVSLTNVYVESSQSTNIWSQAYAGGEANGVVSADSPSILDEVYYMNVVPGENYELRGELVYLDQGVVRPADISSVVSFTPESTSAVVESTFTVSAEKLAELSGQQLFIVQGLYDSTGGMVAFDGSSDANDSWFTATNEWVTLLDQPADPGERTDLAYTGTDVTGVGVIAALAIMLGFVGLGVKVALATSGRRRYGNQA